VNGFFFFFFFFFFAIEIFLKGALFDESLLI